MADSTKRKERPDGDSGDNRGGKRSKGGTNGKWQTPHQKAKALSRGSGRIEPGDAGIWATCARNQEGRATEELKVMFDECAERFYGIKPAGDADDDGDDIEASIQREIAALDNTNKEGKVTKLFSPVHLDIPCVLFFKTRAPIRPVEFVQRICEEVMNVPGVRRMKYVNRLTPMVGIAKATERGLEDLGRVVVGAYFGMNEDAGATPAPGGNHSYAIRPTIRNHTAPLTRDVVIKQIANSIADTHKVDLTAADKTILVEVYQSICGMSVVGSDWESLKRFNLAELYVQAKASSSTDAGASEKSAHASKAGGSASKEESKPQSVTTDEADVVAADV